MKIERLFLGSLIKKESQSCIIFLACSLFSLFFYTNTVAQDTIRLGLGSCNKADHDQSYWQTIRDANIDAWVWLGDIVYADTKNPKKLKKHYSELRCNDYYKQFSKTHDIYGIWDDHDYGDNDGGKDFTIKEKSKTILLKFLKVPKSNAAWNREGAYQAHALSFDANSIKVKLLLLDTRYFRDKLKPNPDPDVRYIPSTKAEILGETQWVWLSEQLEEAEEDVILIGSGTQIIPLEHGYEKWADYPSERSRLMDLLRKHTDKRIILISGDRHMAEVSALALDSDYFLFELTSSGMTHTWSTVKDEKNNFRIKSMFPVKNFAVIQIIKESKVKVDGEIRAIDGTVLDTYQFFPQ